MKTTRWFGRTSLIVAVLATLVIAACGEKGDQGPMGPQGPQGIPGKDGAVIHSGDGPPPESLGAVGDMYLDKTNAVLYGPKSSSGWGTPLDLRGEPGPPGSRILSGTTNPTSDIGSIGDYYLNRSTSDLFGPKTASGWGTPINLKGTANVVASTVLNYVFNETDTPTRKTMRYVIPTPILNAVGATSLLDFLNSGGALLVYGTNFGTSTQRLFDYEYGNARYSYSDNAALSTMYLTIQSTDGSPLDEFDYSSTRGNRFRYVMIPAGVRLTGNVSPQDLAKMDYEEVRALFNLPE
jgi:hypothetical protein